MGHSYSSNFLHCVFSTKQRANIIPTEMEERLWAYLLGIARNHKIELLAAGGTGTMLTCSSLCRRLCSCPKLSTN